VLHLGSVFAALPLRLPLVMKLLNKTALVSGSGRGIGRSIALKLASEGAKGRRQRSRLGTGGRHRGHDQRRRGQAVACPASVTEAGFAERFVQTAIRSIRGIDIIVNNAGTPGTTSSRR